MEKKRLDLVLSEKGFALSRQKAQAIIMAGLVRVDGEKVEKPGYRVSPFSNITVIGSDNPYASRGGLKLDAALKAFDINVKGLTVLDVGASTGGFTSCLLAHGAKKVIAVDVGYGQLAWTLRNDPRVILKERTNIRHLSKKSMTEDLDAAVIDTSFISLRIVIPETMRFLKDGCFILALIKPQFEAGKDMVGKGGVIRDEALQKKIVDDLLEHLRTLELRVLGTFESPLKGAKGNTEFFVYLRNQ